VGIAQKAKLPIVAIGAGEGIADLRPFTAKQFARALLGLEEAA
jgi:fused signal recognition particle receptor